MVNTLYFLYTPIETNGDVSWGGPLHVKTSPKDQSLGAIVAFSQPTTAHRLIFASNLPENTRAVSMDELRELAPDYLLGDRFILYLSREEEVDDYLVKGKEFPFQDFVKPITDFIPKT